MDLNDSSVANDPDVKKQVRGSFVAQAVLGNWDAIGMNFDNVRVNPETKQVWFVDNGGSMRYRAQGHTKPFGDTVDEIDTMRDANINPQSAKFFKNIANDEIRKQIVPIWENKNSILSGIKDEALRTTIENRINDVYHTYG